MKLTRILAPALVALTATGCNSPETEANMPGLNNSLAITSFREAQINKAIIVQRTLYPYHFVTDTAELTKLGHRDLAVLAGYYSKHSGTINVRRGDATQVLYDQRVAAIIESLVAKGVAQGQLTVVDRFPAGDGIPSERVVKILENLDAPLTGAASQSSMDSGSTGGSSAGVGGY